MDTNSISSFWNEYDKPFMPLGWYLFILISLAAVFIFYSYYWEPKVLKETKKNIDKNLKKD